MDESRNSKPRIITMMSERSRKSRKSVVNPKRKSRNRTKRLSLRTTKSSKLVENQMEGRMVPKPTRWVNRML